MGLTKKQQYIAAGIAVLVVLVIIIIWSVRHKAWMKKHCACTGFHGWRHQHYEDNPYNGQRYRCGKGNPPHRDGFTGDIDHWPTSGTFGNTADTNPYGNYAGHIDMYYPTYSEGYVTDMYPTRT